MKQKASVKSAATNNNITRNIILLIVFSTLLYFAYTVLAFFATWGDWTDGYYHEGHPERLAQDMVGNSYAVGMWTGMYIVVQQIVIFKYLQSIPKWIRLSIMLAALVISLVFVSLYTRHILRDVEDNIMHLPQVIQYPGHARH